MNHNELKVTSLWGIPIVTRESIPHGEIRVGAPLLERGVKTFELTEAEIRQLVDSELQLAMGKAMADYWARIDTEVMFGSGGTKTNFLYQPPTQTFRQMMDEMRGVNTEHLLGEYPAIVSHMRQNNG